VDVHRGGDGVQAIVDGCGQGEGVEKVEQFSGGRHKRMTVRIMWPSLAPPLERI
jgi:hypothetical protein